MTSAIPPTNPLDEQFQFITDFLNNYPSILPVDRQSLIVELNRAMDDWREDRFSHDGLPPAQSRREQNLEHSFTIPEMGALRYHLTALIRPSRGGYSQGEAGPALERLLESGILDPYALIEWLEEAREEKKKPPLKKRTKAHEDDEIDDL